MNTVKRVTLRLGAHSQSVPLPFRADELTEVASRNSELAPSQTFVDVPPELCALIARFASRQSLARLCSISRHFCFTFSPLLYANTLEPSLNATQSVRLIKTLSTPQTLPWKVHPAALVRHLGLTSNEANNAKTSPQEPTDALMNLRCRHAGSILDAPGHFPNLKELRVSCDLTTPNFNFLLVEGLEILGVALELILAQALESLPTTSPSLRALHVKLKLPFNDAFPFNNDSFPHLGLHDIVDAINQIHLPALTMLELSPDFYPPEVEPEEVENLLPLVDFAPFLAAHPNLLDLTLTAHGTTLTKDIAFLPRLRSFTGSFHDAAVICANQRQLDRLVLTFVHRSYFDPPSFRALPLLPQASLTKLTVRATKGDGEVAKMTNELSPISLGRLVTAFPNLTHLDVYLSGRLSDYRKSLIRLPNLQSLRVQEYRKSFASPSVSITAIFPAAEYTKELRRLLPSLPQLTSVDISVLGDTSDEDLHSCCECGGCSDYGGSDDGDERELMNLPAQMKVDYRFFIARTSSEVQVVLADTRVSDVRDVRVQLFPRICDRADRISSYRPS
ncbi:hypothetical protein C8R46DRAFT_1243936 [Mycena filopes]|nr:hypothetical protein C8R46DRAFT_1243936 [Mycena filopes]